MALSSSFPLSMDQIRQEVVGNTTKPYDFVSTINSSLLTSKTLPIDFGKFLGYQQNISETGNPTSLNWNYNYSGSGYAYTSTVVICTVTATITAIPSWMTVRDSTDHVLAVSDVVNANDVLNMYPTANNTGAYRSGNLSFSLSQVGNAYQTRNTGSFYIGLSQQAAPATTTYTWQVGNQETFTISNNTHGMTDGYNTFSLSFDSTFTGDAWKTWTISKVGYGLLASGSGNPDGVRIRTGITSTKNGTLATSIQAGDVIQIQIGLSED